VVRSPGTLCYAESRLLLFSGLRIRDAVTIEFSRFNDEGKLLLYTQKTGQPVFLPLPADVVMW